MPKTGTLEPLVLDAQPERSEDDLLAEEVLRLRATVGQLERERAELAIELEELHTRAQRSIALQELAQAFGARQVTRQLGEEGLLSMLAHELRSPLQVLLMQLESSLTRLRGSADEVPRDWMLSNIEKSERAVLRLRRLTDTFVNIAQLSAGKLDLHLEAVDVRNVVLGVLHRMTEDLNWVGCPCTVEEGGAAWARADRRQLELVVTNVLSNALKFGLGKPIHVQLSENASWIRLKIQDQGIGISSEDQHRIFERFERASGKKTITGLGLGLWVVRQLVDAMGGRVEVKSQPGKGSGFVIILPSEGGSRRH